MTRLRLEDLPPNLRAQIQKQENVKSGVSRKGGKGVHGVPNHACATCGEPYRSDKKANEHTTTTGHTRWTCDLTRSGT